MDNLIEMLGKQVTPGVLGQLSGMMGESEDATGSAVKAVLPSLMGAMVSKGSTESGAQELLDLMNNQPDDFDVSGDIGAMLGDQGSASRLTELGGPIVSGLLGNKSGGMLDMISSVAGIKKEGASSMMGMLAPIAMGMVRKQLGLGGGGMNASGLMSILGGQSKFVEAALPAGLSSLMGGMGGLGDLAANLTGPDVNLKGSNVDLNGPDIDVDLNGPDIDIKGPNVDLNAPDVNLKGPNVDLDAPDVDVNLKGANVDMSGPKMEASIDKPSGGIGRWLLPLLLILALLAGLLWYLIPGLSGGSADLGATLDAGKVAVEGAVEGAVEAGGAVVEGAVEAGGAVVEGAVEAGGAVVEGAVEAGGAVVEGAVDAGEAVVEGAVEAGEAVVEAGKDAVSGGISIGQAAICAGVTSIDEAMTGLPEINADTDAGVVGESFGLIKTAYDSIMEAAADSEIPGLDLLTTAFEGLDEVISGLPASGAIGDAFESIQEAFTSFTDSSKEFATGLSCE